MVIITSVPVTGKQFFNRIELLEMIKDRIRSFISGNITFIALIGKRKIGKTSVLLHLDNIIENVQFVYINFEVAVTSPVDFAITYINEVINQVKGETLETASDLEDYALKHKTTYSRVLLKLLKEYRNKNHYLCLKMAFNFPELLAKEERIKILLRLDEFQELLEFNRYQLNPLSIFRDSFQKQKEILYVLSGSHVRVLTRVIRDHKSPLFGHFDLLELKPFDKNTSKEFVKNLLEFKIDPKALDFLVNFTGGMPYYIQSLCLEIRDLIKKKDEEIANGRIIIEAIINQVIDAHGTLYQYCKYLYDTSLERARGGGILKKIILLIANNINAPSQLAKEINTPIQSVMTYLTRLIEVDVIIRLEDRYFINDNLFKFWIVNTYLNIKDPKIGDIEKRVVKIRDNLYEQIARLKSERGTMFESYVKEKIKEKFNGQKISGKYFDIKGEGKIQLPIIKELKVIRTDGEELADFLLVGSENWLAEIRGRFKEASGHDIKQLIKRKEEVEKIEKIKINRLLFISESGFKENARKIAKEEGVLLLNKSTLENL